MAAADGDVVVPLGDGGTVVVRDAPNVGQVSVPAAMQTQEQAVLQPLSLSEEFCLVSRTSALTIARFPGDVARFVDDSYPQNQTGSDSRSEYEQYLDHHSDELDHWRAVAESPELMTKYGHQVPVLFPPSPNYSRRFHSTTLTLNFEAPCTSPRWKTSVDQSGFHTLFRIHLDKEILGKYLEPNPEMRGFWFMPLIITFEGDESTVANVPDGSLFALQILTQAYALPLQQPTTKDQKIRWVNGTSSAPRELVTSATFGPDEEDSVKIEQHDVGFSFGPHCSGRTQVFSADAEVGTRAFRTLSEARHMFGNHVRLNGGETILPDAPDKKNECKDVATYFFVRHFLVGARTHLTKANTRGTLVKDTVRTSRSEIVKSTRALYESLGLGTCAPIMHAEGGMDVQVCLLSSPKAWNSFVDACAARKMDHVNVTFNLKVHIMGVFV